MNVPILTHHGAACYHLASDLVSLFVTRVGGQMAPVVFNLGGRKVSPYALAPWLPDEVDQDLPVLLKNLRGDFFCLPFGPQERGQPHGETANFPWDLVSESENSMVLRIGASDVGAEITKTLSLRPGETAIYYEHRIEGLDGDFSYGNHPILDLSGLPEGAGRVSVSPFRWASVYPGWFSDPADGAKQALQEGSHFTDLAEVPLIGGGHTDLGRYPARPGNDDLVMMVSEPASEAQPFAWSAVVLDGYVWFSLKNPADFPTTLLWMSHGGRRAAPWDSRHTGRLGVEDVCSYFCDSVDRSREDRLAGIPTTRRFDPKTPVILRNILAVAAVPANVGRVASILPDGPGKVILGGENGGTVAAAVSWEFLA